MFHLLSLIGSGGGGGWTPAQLFSDGVNGAWVDPSDLSTLFQNAGGTVPAVVGDPVRLIRDKSGNANHLTAPSDAARGVLRQDARGKYYIECSVAQFYVTAAASFSISIPTYNAVAFQAAGGTECTIFGVVKATNNYFGVVTANNNRLIGRLVDVAAGGAVGATTASASHSDNIITVADALLLDGAMEASVNGGTSWAVTGTPAAPLSTAGQVLGINASSTVGASGLARNFYGGVIVFGAVSAENRALTNADLKEKCGISALEALAYDIFVIILQSNGVGQGDKATSPAVAWGLGVEYEDGFIKPLCDPTRHYATDVSGNPSATGSMWPSFVIEYFAQTGRRVCIVGAAANGAGVHSFWSVNDPYRTFAASKALAAKTFIEAKGGTAIIKGIIAVGFESDAIEGVSKATVKTDFVGVHSALKTLLSMPVLPMYITSVDQSTDSGQDAAFALMRTAQSELDAENVDMYLVMPYQEFETNGMLEDTIHFNQTALNQAGEIVAQGVATVAP